MISRRILLVLLLGLAVHSAKARGEEQEPPTLRAAALAGNRWVWLYVERGADMVVLTLPISVNQGKSSGKLTVAESKTEVAALITGPAAQRHAMPKPPQLYHYRNTVPKDGKHRIVPAAAGVIQYTYEPGQQRGSFGAVHCDITQLEFPGLGAIEKLHVDAKVDSLPP